MHTTYPSVKLFALARRCQSLAVLDYSPESIRILDVSYPGRFVPKPGRFVPLPWRDKFIVSLKFCLQTMKRETCNMLISCSEPKTSERPGQTVPTLNSATVSQCSADQGRHCLLILSVVY